MDEVLIINNSKGNIEELSKKLNIVESDIISSYIHQYRVPELHAGRFLKPRPAAKFSVLGHLAERHLAERHLAERHLAEKTSCRKTLCRKDILPKGHCAESH